MQANSAATALSRRIEPAYWELGLGVVTVFGFLFLLFVVLKFFFFHWLQLQRINRDYLEFGSTLRARYHFAFIDLVFFDVQVAFTLRTRNHKSSVLGKGPANI